MSFHRKDSTWWNTIVPYDSIWKFATNVASISSISQTGRDPPTDGTGNVACNNGKKRNQLNKLSGNRAGDPISIKWIVGAKTLTVAQLLKCIKTFWFLFTEPGKFIINQLLLQMTFSGIYHRSIILFANLLYRTLTVNYLCYLSGCSVYLI